MHSTEKDLCGLYKGEFVHVIIMSLWLYKGELVHVIIMSLWLYKGELVHVIIMSLWLYVKQSTALSTLLDKPHPFCIQIVFASKLLSLEIRQNSLSSTQ